MATIIFLDEARSRRSNARALAAKPSHGCGEVLMFTGVRHERLPALAGLPEASNLEPMFDDTAPEKPTRRKRTRSKNA